MIFRQFLHAAPSPRQFCSAVVGSEMCGSVSGASILAMKQ
jgi:hypothetical protein